MACTVFADRRAEQVGRYFPPGTPMGQPVPDHEAQNLIAEEVVGHHTTSDTDFGSVDSDTSLPTGG